MRVEEQHPDRFIDRHLGQTEGELGQMLQSIRAESVEQLIQQTVPQSIRRANMTRIPEAVSESVFLENFQAIASKNKVFQSYIGTGYHPCTTPAVIQRNVLENPGWYTAYTPYQAEIAQGRLEALINFQTLISELTGMDLANASLLDEATAAAEAMTMLYALRKKDKKTAHTFVVSKNVHPQTKTVLKTRAAPLGIQLEFVGDEDMAFSSQNLFGQDVYGVILQYPGSDGKVIDYATLIAKAKENNVAVAVATDLMSLCILRSPGEMGADVVVGTAQRFGVPMGYGGPHAAFFATKEDYKRQIPGRIIGVSKDQNGNPAYRMALQTREQHIRREKATSNICTAQVLLAVMSGFYAVYHGPKRLKEIAQRIHGMTCLLDREIQALGFEQLNTHYFDTLRVKIGNITLLKSLAENAGINFRYFDDSIGISLHENIGKTELEAIVNLFSRFNNQKESFEWKPDVESALPKEYLRTDEYLSQKVFHQYHTEHGILRYMKSLENKDLSLVHSMISLGSCTMKLNATAEMIPVTWPSIARIHPYAPDEQTGGYKEMISKLEQWLCDITGFHGISFQPNSGAQGEYAGLMVIRQYHRHRGDSMRNVVLIPSSAHGTNPASAVMAGFKVVIVGCDEKGNIDLEDLKEKAEKHSKSLAGLMVTYPSTHGVFESIIKEVCDLIHQHGGQVYMDGANMNAQVGLTSPAEIGADVCHLNLHKTFCIPHGGGGPGMGPIGVAEHLVEFLPQDPLQGEYAVSAAKYGSASILPISYAYIAMMGVDGIKRATEIAILNANYIMSRIKPYYEILYLGASGRAAHEFIVDLRRWKEKAGIEVEDVAKRLMDYGFHAPTVSFPVPGTMMVEPTESETKEELDRFCEALIEISIEVKEIEEGLADREDNVLKNAPHTQYNMLGDWDRPYTRAKAVYPLPFVKQNKFWPAVNRVDNAYGDRNLICSCDPLEVYMEVEEQDS